MLNPTAAAILARDERVILTFLGDRMEMSHSIEGRVPFLDHHVAEYAAHVPIDMKIRGIREKHVLREATKDCLIDAVYHREKHPFTTPPAKNSEDPMMQFFRDTLASRALDAQPIYDPLKVRSLADVWRTAAADQRIAVEGIMNRIVSTTVMHDRFRMSTEVR